MQHLKDDMDDIFKLASEQYPLKTDSANWEAVQQKLAGGASSVNNKTIAGSIKQLAIVGIMMLVPLGVAVTDFVFKSYPTPLLTSMPAHKQGRSLPAATRESIPAYQSKKIPVLTTPGNGAAIVTDISSLDILPGTINENIPAVYTHKSSAGITATVSTTIPLLTAVAHVETLPAHGNLGNIIAANQQAPLPVSDAKAAKLKTTVKKKHLYAGPVVAPEITRVKSQPVSKTGSNIGGVIGYNFHNRLQVEMGVVLAHKYFYTDGKYTAPNSMRKDDAEIKGVQAFTSITEIPVTLRYNFSNASKANILYASGGLVSYVVHKEQYSFGYEQNGVQRRGSKKYSKSAGNLFSNVQISMGLEHKVGKIGSVRVEPYYRIPFNGIGVSDIPVTSAGINIGFVTYLK